MRACCVVCARRRPRDVPVSGQGAQRKQRRRSCVPQDLRRCGGLHTPRSAVRYGAKLGVLPRSEPRPRFLVVVALLGTVVWRHATQHGNTVAMSAPIRNVAPVFVAPPLSTTRERHMAQSPGLAHCHCAKNARCLQLVADGRRSSVGSQSGD